MAIMPQISPCPAAPGRELNRLTKTFIFLHASRSKVDYRQARAKKPREMEVHSRGFLTFAPHSMG